MIKMTATAILTFIFATMGLVFVGITANQMLNNQQMKDGFTNCVSDFIHKVADTVEYQTKYARTYRLIKQYYELGKTLADLEKFIIDSILKINAGTAVIGITVWGFFREMCNAIAENIVEFKMSSTELVSNAQQIAEINEYTNFDDTLKFKSYTGACLELAAYLISQGVNVLAIYGKALENDNASKVSTGYYDGVIGLSLYYQIDTENPTTRTFTGSNGQEVTYYEPYNSDEKLTFELQANPSSTAVLTGVGIVKNESGKNISNSVSCIRIYASSEVETGGIGYKSLAEYYEFQHLFPTSRGLVGASNSDFIKTFFNATYVCAFVTAYVNTYYSITQTIFNGQIEGASIKVSPLSEVYNKVLGVGDTAIGDVLTPSRIEDDGEIYGGLSINIPQTWVETYPSIGALDTSLAGTLADVNVYPWVKDQTIVVPNEQVGVIDDVLSDTLTAEDVLDNLDTLPNPITPPIIQNPITSVSTSGFITLFNPTLSELSQLNDVLWSEDFITNFLKTINNPMDGIISLLATPIQPSISGRTNVTFGNFDSGISMRKVSNQYGSFSCGSIEIKGKFGNYLDYAPYTKVSLYLPFIGFVELNTNEVMNATVGVNYNIDFLTGECIAQVIIGKTGLTATAYVFNGNMGMQLPLTGSNYSRFYSSIVSGAVSAGLAVASGGTLAPIVVGGIANTAMNSGGSVQHSGNISGNSGFLGEFRPYVIVTLPVPNMADNYNEIEGYVANDNVQIGSRSGFVRVNEVHLSIPNATADEVKEIESLLKLGVEV